MTKIASSFRYLGLGLLALTGVGAFPSYATTLTVTNTNDSGAGSFRQATADAQTGDQIVFGVTGTIVLGSDLYVAIKNLTITGPGVAKLVIDGAGHTLVLGVPYSTMALSGFTFQNGGEIFNYTNLSLRSMLVKNNIYRGLDNFGPLTVENCTFSGNTSDFFGGAILNEGGVPLTISDSTFTGNSAGPGGLENDGGGAIDDIDSGHVTISNSVFVGNSSVNTDGGGAIYATGYLNVVNSTFINNVAKTDNYISFGGAVFSRYLQGTIVNSTFVGNSATGNTGSVYGYLTLKNTLLAHTTDANDGNCSTDSGIASAGYNLSDDSSCSAFFNQPTDKNNVPAQLDPKGLQDNGGPTQTIALLPASPAVDAIPVAACTDTNNNPVKTDQRGITRPQGKGCDIGAYELVQAVPFASFHPALIIDTGKKPGFILTSTFTLGSGTSGLHPAAEVFTLQIANYTLTLPAGSFHQLWSGSNAPYGYEGTVNGATVALILISLGNDTYSFNAAGSPVTFPGLTNPVAVTLTFGNDTGTSSVKALRTNY